MKIHGTTTALITPFTNDTSAVDYTGLEMLVDRQLEAQIDCILPLGTTGETPTLSSDEKEKVLATVVKRVNGKVPVMVGTGAYSTEASIAATKKAQELGADIALIVSPYYNKPSQEGLYAHFAAIADSVDIPIVVYNIAGRTGVNIETATLQRIATLKSVIGVKESSGNIAQGNAVLQEIQAQKENFSVLSGDDYMTLPLMAMGAKGVVSVTSNLVPREVRALVQAMLTGDLESARERHFELLSLFDTLFIESNPVPIKTAMRAWGLPAGGVRLPLVPLQTSNNAILEKALANFQSY